MAWDERLTRLNRVVAGLYPFADDTLRVVEAAGLPKAQIAFSRRAIDTWFSILQVADRRNRLAVLVGILQQDHPDDPFLQQAAEGTLDDLQGPLYGDLDWQAPEDGAALEKITGSQSTLLPISFLSVGLERARSVARIVVPAGVGTGFLIRDNLLVTNHHVIGEADSARAARVQFNFQNAESGLALEPTEFELDPDSGFWTSEPDDWTVVRVRGEANHDWGMIELRAVEVKKGGRVNIIQHPGGGPKQIGLYRNVVAYADEARIQYLTDTLPGSSGSPVFDSDWNLVAVHHSGGHIREPGSKRIVFRNEGIHVSRVVEGIEAGVE